MRVIWNLYIMLDYGREIMNIQNKYVYTVCLSTVNMIFLVEKGHPPIGLLLSPGKAYTLVTDHLNTG